MAWASKTAVEAPRLHVERDGKTSFEPGLPEPSERAFACARRAGACLAETKSVLWRRACRAPPPQWRRRRRRRSSPPRRRDYRVTSFPRNRFGSGPMRAPLPLIVNFRAMLSEQDPSRGDRDHEERNRHTPCRFRGRRHAGRRARRSRHLAQLSRSRRRRSRSRQGRRSSRRARRPDRHLRDRPLSVHQGRARNRSRPR